MFASTTRFGLTQVLGAQEDFGYEIKSTSPIGSDRTCGWPCPDVLLTYLLGLHRSPTVHCPTGLSALGFMAQRFAQSCFPLTSSRA
jgi:hypothetical protein